MTKHPFNEGTNFAQIFTIYPIANGIAVNMNFRVLNPRKQFRLSGNMAFPSKIKQLIVIYVRIKLFTAGSYLQNQRKLRMSGCNSLQNYEKGY